MVRRFVGLGHNPLAAKKGVGRGKTKKGRHRIGPVQGLPRPRVERRELSVKTRRNSVPVSPWESIMSSICDFARSFVSFTTLDHENTARLQLEARCVFFDESEDTDEYLLFASCKAEDTYGTGALFRMPNYDFCGVFGDEDYALIRAHLVHDDRYAERGKAAARFADVSRHLTVFAHSEALTHPGAVVAATLAGHPLVGRTELRSATGHVRAMLEYPIKTMNVHANPDRFQVDTGPVLLPGPDCPKWQRIQGLELAFVAFNRLGPGRAEFMVQRPTPVVVEGETVAHVNHYSTPVSLNAANQVIAAIVSA